MDSDLSDGPVTAQEYMQVKNALVASEVKIQQLMKVNINLSDELRIMQKKVTEEPLPPALGVSEIVKIKLLEMRMK